MAGICSKHREFNIECKLCNMIAPYVLNITQEEWETQRVAAITDKVSLCAYCGFPQCDKQNNICRYCGRELS